MVRAAVQTRPRAHSGRAAAALAETGAAVAAEAAGSGASKMAAAEM